jgi:hypothetical protein
MRCSKTCRRGLGGCVNKIHLTAQVEGMPQSFPRGEQVGGWAGVVAQPAAVNVDDRGHDGNRDGNPGPQARSRLNADGRSSSLYASLARHSLRLESKCRPSPDGHGAQSSNGLRTAIWSNVEGRRGRPSTGWTASRSAGRSGRSCGGGGTPPRSGLRGSTGLTRSSGRRDLGIHRDPQLAVARRNGAARDDVRTSDNGVRARRGPAGGARRRTLRAVRIAAARVRPKVRRLLLSWERPA